MGSCSSVICADKSHQKMNECHAAKIHTRRNKMRLKEAVGTALKASPSVELLNIESTDDSLLGESSSSISLENDSDINLPQELLQALKIYGTPWPHSRHRDARVRSVKHHKEFSFSREEERKLEKGNKADQSEYRNSPPKELSSALSAPLRHFSYTWPPPRPSPWKEVYMPGGGTWVHFCWVCAAGLSEPLPHYSLFCGQL